MERYENFKETNTRKNDRANKCFVTILSIVFVVLMFFLGALLGYRINFEYITVDGLSMQNTINPNPDQVFVQTDNGIETHYYQDGVIIERKQNPQRGEIVVLNIPNWPDTIIKRVIATQGDLVTIRQMEIEQENGESVKQYRVIVANKGEDNFSILDEEYVKSYEEWSESKEHAPKLVGGIYYESNFYDTFLKNNDQIVYNGNTMFYQVPQGQIFYLGDNRAHSSDSRFFGCAKYSQIEGIVRVFIRDAYTMKQNGTLNWNVFKRSFSYIFDQLSDYFAWKS